MYGATVKVGGCAYTAHERGDTKMTPAHWATVLAAGASMAFENGDGRHGAILTAMAEQCRRIHATDNPAHVITLPDASTIAMPALPEMARGLIAAVPYTFASGSFKLAVPMGWRLVQVLPEMASSSKTPDALMCVMVPDA